MKVSSAREFQAHALEFMDKGEPVFVTRHGQVSALLLPLDRPDEIPLDLRRELLVEIGKSLARHLTRRGIGEVRLHRDFKAWRHARRPSRRRR